MNFTNVLPSTLEVVSLMQPLKNTLRLLTGQPPRRDVLSLSEYDIDPVSGFFPSIAPLRLEGEHTVWEKALDDAKGKISLGEDTRAQAKAKRAYGETWRNRIRTMPILATDTISGNTQTSQRAHMVLAFLIHFYVHSQPPSSDPSRLVVPASLSVPIVAVSRALGMAPVLTLADTVLWNARPLDPSLPLSASNVHFAHLFSDTEAEKQFYISSIKPELLGVEILHIFEHYHGLLNPADPRCVSRTARDIASLVGPIKRITQVMVEIKTEVDPYQFYWEVRPWFRGSGPTSDPTTRWVYEGVPETSQLDLAGPSAGQSTMIHALDVFLDVDHKQVKHRPVPQTPANRNADRGFMERMWRYMPSGHRRYLEDIRSCRGSVRTVAQDSPLLREAYDQVVLALKEFRDAHIQIATLFIISMARSHPPGSLEEAAERAQFVAQGASRGTGGMSLSTQLKSGRDSTTRTLLGSS